MKGDNVINDWILHDDIGNHQNMVSNFFTFYSETNSNGTNLQFKVSLGNTNYRGNTANLLSDVFNNCAPWFKRALFLYNFYKDGYDFGVNSYVNRITLSMLNEIRIRVEENEEYKDLTYSQFLRRILAGQVEIDVIDFMQQFVLNHPDFDIFTYTPKGEQFEKQYRDLAFEEGTFQDGEWTSGKWKDEFEIYITKDDNGRQPYSELLLQST